MERRPENARKGRLATVVRQFSPSRIERELLAQAFEVVVAGAVNGQRPSASEPVSTDGRLATSDQVELAAMPTLTRSVA